MKDGKNSVSIDFSKDGDEVWIPADLAGKGFVSATGIKMIGITGGTVPLTASYKPKLSSFYIGETEITQAQYKAVIDWAKGNATSKYPNIGNSSPNPSGFSSNPDGNEIQENRPVEQISWFDAVMFCNLLTMKELGAGECVYDISGTGYNGSNISSATVTLVSDWESKKGYRLPTEAEWEYAARSGNTDPDANVNQYGNPDPKGNSIDDYAWYTNNGNNKTHEVKKKLPNSYNLYDMSGNVYEWCWDLSNTTSYNTSQTADPTGVTSSTNSQRAYRGGNYTISARNCKVNGRFANMPYNSGDSANFMKSSFRVARSQ